MEITVLQGLWFLLIFVLIAGYFVLDGFDLGAGILYPFVAKTDEDKAVVRTSIGPVWDANEVWLLTAGGALFAAFPDAYATTFSGFYLAVMLVLFSLIVRAVAVEYAGIDRKWRKVWNALFFVGSLLPALLLGVAVGNIYAGIPLDAAGNYAGIPLLGLITPFTLLTGVLSLVMFVAAGACWLSLKAPLGSSVRDSAAALRRPLLVAVLVLFVLESAMGHFVVQPEMFAGLTAVRWILAILVVLAIVGAAFFCAKGGRDGLVSGGLGAAQAAAVTKSDLAAFLCQAAGCFLLVMLLAASMFPNLVVASAGSVGASITAMTAGSSELTLGWMTGITCVGLPLVLVYHVVIYRTFRGRVDLAKVHY